MQPELTGRVAGRLAGKGNLRAVRAERAAPGWIFAYLAVQVGCQLCLLVSELAPFRIAFRSMAFGTSLAFLALVPGSARGNHPARILAMAALCIVTLSALSPHGGAPLAVLAHWVFYLAIVAPLFWVARIEVTEHTLGALLLVLWTYHTLSSLLGVLQAYYPGEFMPALTSLVGKGQVLSIRLASGQWIPRPMGLTDTPGGAGPSGLYAALLGFGVVLARPFPFARLIGVASMIAGMSAIYLSQVRVALVMLGVCFVVLLGVFVLAGRVSRVGSALVLAVIVIFIGFEVAFVLGGDTVTSRLASLVQFDPATTYQRNRGFMLEHTFTHVLPTYPLGAGLGHWGMMNLYFGSVEDEIGAEVQWTGWLLDGGIPLLIAYPAAVLAAIYHAIRTATRVAGTTVGSWIAIVAAYGVGTFALCFSYAPFMATSGLEFWLLNAVLIQTSGTFLANAQSKPLPAPTTSRISGSLDGASRPSHGPT